VFGRVWRYQRGNQNPHIEEEQWSKEKVQKNKQRSTKHTYKTKDRVTRAPLKTGGKLMCSGRVSSSCLNSGTRREPRLVMTDIVFFVKYYYVCLIKELVILKNSSSPRYTNTSFDKEDIMVNHKSIINSHKLGKWWHT
jgi:hypothetical protein